MRIQLIEALTSAAVFVDKVCAPKQPKVPGNGGARNGERLGNLAGGAGVTPKQIQDGAARWIGDGTEHGFVWMCG